MRAGESFRPWKKFFRRGGFSRSTHQGPQRVTGRLIVGKIRAFLREISDFNPFREKWFFPLHSHSRREILSVDRFSSTLGRYFFYVSVFGRLWLITGSKDYASSKLMTFSELTVDDRNRRK